MQLVRKAPALPCQPPAGPASPSGCAKVEGSSVALETRSPSDKSWSWVQEVLASSRVFEESLLMNSHQSRAGTHHHGMLDPF